MLDTFTECSSQPSVKRITTGSGKDAEMSTRLLAKCKFNHVIQRSFMLPPSWSFLIQQFEEICTMIVMFQMRQLMDHDIVYAVPRRLDEMRV